MQTLCLHRFSFFYFRIPTAKPFDEFYTKNRKYMKEENICTLPVICKMDI